MASRPELTQVRTRHRSPQTNGIIERFFESVKYDRLYRLEVPDGHVLHEEAQAYGRIYNEIRPNEHLDFETPIGAYLTASEDTYQGESIQKTRRGTDQVTRPIGYENRASAAA